VTDSLLRLLLLLPVVAGVPLLAWSGVLGSAFGVIWGTAAMAGAVYLAGSWLLRPRRALARRARQLAPGGSHGGDDWAQLDACLDALGRQREQDRTRIRELEARLHRAQAAADSADTAKRAFLANVGHEIRTPMNVVVGMTRLALKQAVTAQQRDHLLRADRAAHGVLNQINNLLDVAKLEAGELRLERSAFAPGEMLSQLVAGYAEQARRKCLALRAELDPHVPAAVVGDPARLQQVLAGPTDNALKFTDSGEIVLACNLSERAGGQARLGFEVRDTAADDARSAPPDEQLDALAAQRKLGVLGAQVRAMAVLLADVDAAAINAFEPLRGRLAGVVPGETIDALQNAINGFDFSTAGELLQDVAEALGVVLAEGH
jgi:signal transduction histidine kinase